MRRTVPREVEEKGTKGTGQKGFNLAPSLMFPLPTAHVMCACVCMCCVPLAGTGEDWVKVVVRKVKKRKREAVLRDRKEEEGKGERGKGYYLAILLQVMMKDLRMWLLMGGQNMHKGGRWVGSSRGWINGSSTS